MRNLSKDFKGQRPLLIQPAQAEAYLNRVGDMEIPMSAKMSDMGEMLSAIFGEKPTLEKFPPFAIIPVKGVIGKNLSELESMCGCCDIHDVEEMLEECERDTSIKTIILDIDSPGGTSVGVPELANRIKNCTKEVISFTGNECCSAAYWLGSQASKFYATPSASVGSIGVYIAFPDCSEAFKMEGVRMDVIKSGAYKGAGIPGTSLDEGQRKMLQMEVEDIHADFKEAVKSVRSFVEDSSMEGQMFSGKRGAEAGLVTSLTNGFDEMLQELDAAVFAQVESDEENDKRHADEMGASSEEESEDEKAFAKVMTAASRALAGLKIKMSEDDKDEDKKANGDEDEEDEDEEKKSKSDDEDKPKDEDEEDEKKSEGDDEDKKSEDEEDKPDSKSDDEDKPKDEDEDEEKKSEDEDEEKKSEDDDKGTEPQPDGEDEPEDGKSKEDADDENDSGEKAVETDSKHNKESVKKNRSKGVA
jgi:signal peptide peptidase SppA